MNITRNEYFPLACFLMVAAHLLLRWLMKEWRWHDILILLLISTAIIDILFGVYP